MIRISMMSVIALSLVAGVTNMAVSDTPRVAPQFVPQLAPQLAQRKTVAQRIFGTWRQPKLTCASASRMRLGKDMRFDSSGLKGTWQVRRHLVTFTGVEFDPTNLDANGKPKTTMPFKMRWKVMRTTENTLRIRINKKKVVQLERCK